ncbi:MAG: porin [Rhizobiaceae bacterium]
MSIKSLLIGSAAALVAVSGARAADAIVMPEPEPVEYVRVCDMYGAGFFYIPGTETCLAVSGKVWFQIAASSQDVGDTGATVNWNGFAAARQFYGTNVEADVQFDARSETEWGTLRGYVRLRASWDPQNQVLGSTLTNILGVVPVPPGILNSTSRFGTDGNVALDQAFLSLGGLRMGYTESAWADTMNGGASSWGSHTWGGLYYGYQQRHVVQYSFTGGNGLFATLSLEDDGNVNWMPDIVAVAGVNQGWGAVWVKGAYDEDISTSGFLVGERAAALSGVDGWAASAGVQINVPNMEGSSFRLLGFYANNCNAYAISTLNTCANWSVLGSYYHTFSPTFAASVGAQYFDAFAGLPNQWSGELALIWTPVTNFEVRTELNYDKAQGLGGTGSGFLRFTRYF